MKKFIIIILILLLIISILIIVYKFRNAVYSLVQSTVSQKVYYAEDFGIESLKSSTDYDNDGIDDYSDILEGARIDALNHPTYKSAYYDGGYPPDNEGVCTDVIWRAFKNAGYSLKDMIDEDIINNIDSYPRVNGKPDPNIDFRRVPNLMVYFERNHISLTTDLNQIAEWQAGDIVTFSNNHIGIISDKRNKKGIPYIIHNGGPGSREEDGLEFYSQYWEPISAHYRFKDAALESN